MALGAVLALVAGAGAGFAVAKRLLADDDLPERLPEPARQKASFARSRLVEVREDAAYAMREARAERERAKRELMNDYLRRAGRPPQP